MAGIEEWEPVTHPGQYLRLLHPRRRTVCADARVLAAVDRRHRWRRLLLALHSDGTRPRHARLQQRVDLPRVNFARAVATKERLMIRPCADSQLCLFHLLPE